jgi:hypothetical protein
VLLAWPFLASHINAKLVLSCKTGGGISEGFLPAQIGRRLCNVY